ncbi:hypothetical protein Tco_0465992 [Tanacetum coccineum]
MGSPESCSESEVIDQFSSTSEEDSDFERWQFSGENRRSFDCSDGSISDEESLIEIALPGGHYVGYKDFRDEEKEERKLSCRKRSPESVLWWPEMNEEENMIEIDISVGTDVVRDEPGWLRWPPRVTLRRLLPHARGLEFKPLRGSGAKKEWGLSPKTNVRILHTAQLDATVSSNH